MRHFQRQGFKIRNYLLIGSLQLAKMGGQPTQLVSNGFKKYSFYRLLAKRRDGIDF